MLAYVVIINAKMKQDSVFFSLNPNLQVQTSDYVWQTLHTFKMLIKFNIFTFSINI